MTWAWCRGWWAITSRTRAIEIFRSWKCFATGDFQEISLNNWIRRLPPEMVTAALKPTHDDISKISADPGDFIVPR
jgi:hypothetical protein